jgi:hypothetical protein
MEGVEESRLRVHSASQEGLTGTALRAFLWADARNYFSICFLVWALQQGLMYRFRTKEADTQKILAGAIGPRDENPILDKDIQTSLEQLRNIEKKVAFDPTVLIDLEDYDAMCA